ncbi:BlaI/MecI/CopY family transcriptional regulator [Planctomycetota bacterium]
MAKVPKISESEWLVMQVFWSQGGLTADEVVAALKGQTKWNPLTTKTLITRLLKKGALKFKKEGRKYRYFPAVKQELCIRQERRSFVHRVYGGTAQPMLAAFIEDAKLSSDDIAELKRMLDKKAKE